MVGGSGGPGPSNADWIHLNAISYNVDFDQIVISSRFQDEIFVLDHSTTSGEAAGHSGGNYGRGGDFLYRWGNPQNYDRGSSSDQIISDQHSINWIPAGYLGENNFILFNNYHSGSGVWGESAVLEFVPPVDEDGNYTIEEGEPYGPENYIWSYDEDIFSAMQGGAFRLPNGNTLITDCDSAHILEITNEGNIVWEYTYNGYINSIIARAQKYDVNYFDSYILEGDINSDGILNILDIVSLINLVLSDDFEEAGDINGDAMLNVLDIVILMNLILEG